MQAIADIVHMTIFSYITIIKDLINYKNFANYVSFMI